MRIRPGFSIRKVLDVYVVMGTGSGAYVPSEIMSLNEAGALLWRQLEGGSDAAALADALCAEYGIGAETAQRDVDAFLAQLRKQSLLEA